MKYWKNCEAREKEGLKLQSSAWQLLVYILEVPTSSLGPHFVPFWLKFFSSPFLFSNLRKYKNNV